MTSNNTNHPQVWVGCLGCYNDGRLVSEWIDVEDAEDITIDSLHGYLPATLRTQVERDSAHDELWCFDTNNMPQSGEMQPMDAARGAGHKSSSEMTRCGRPICAGATTYSMHPSHQR